MTHALEKMMLGASSCLLLLAACSTDKAFDDLDDVDLTIQVGSSGLTLPVGSTDRVRLTEVMDPATVDVLDTLANGDFVLNQDGTFDPTGVQVDPVTVHLAPEIAPDQFGFEGMLQDQTLQAAVNAFLATNGQTSSAAKLTDIPGVTAASTSLTSVQYENIAFDDCTLDFKATDVDAGLVALRSAQLETPHEMQIAIAVSGLPDAAQAYNLQLTNVVINLPEYLKVQGQPVGRIDVGAKTLTKAAGQSTASTTFSYLIEGIDCSDCRPGGEWTVENGTLSDQSNIRITADAKIDKDLTISTTDLKLDSGVVKLATPIEIAPTVTIGDVTFANIVGRFDPTIDAISTDVELDLGEDMDFLKQEDATIDPTNPIITLNLQNPCEVKVLADLVLTSDNGKAPITITDVDLSQPVVTLSREAVSSAAYNKVAPTLGTLLNPIPEHIQVRIAPRADRDNFYPLTLGRNYQIGGDYLVAVPLEFNNLEINYDETVENVFGDTPEDVQDVADKLPEGITGAVLSFTVTNAIPVALDLSVTATNTQGVEDPSLVTYSNSQTIAAGSLASPTTSSQEVTVGVRDVAAVRDLIVRVHGKAQGATLNAGQYLQFDHMKLTIKNVVLDLNDDDD